jgi:hypothetical protein
MALRMIGKNLKSQKDALYYLKSIELKNLIQNTIHNL